MTSVHGCVWRGAGVGGGGCVVKCRQSAWSFTTVAGLSQLQPLLNQASVVTLAKGRTNPATVL